VNHGPSVFGQVGFSFWGVMGRELWFVCRLKSGRWERLGGRFLSAAAANKQLQKLVTSYAKYLQCRGLDPGMLTTYCATHRIVEYAEWTQQNRSFRPSPPFAGDRARVVPIEPFRLAPAGHDR
jgi:hypothetical protein